MDAYIQELTRSLPDDFKAKGDLYVFVDECHRTQSGKLHQAMERLLPEAVLIGFTGTPLLKKDKQTSLEVFGPYIHTYKFDEAVADKVVLDLRYEARDVEQKLTSPQKVDEWFELKTSGLTDLAKAELKQKWGTLKKVFSSKSRLEKIAMDIMLDMMGVLQHSKETDLAQPGIRQKNRCNTWNISSRMKWYISWNAITMSAFGLIWTPTFPTGNI